MPYVDVYVLPVLKTREVDYLDWARLAQSVWMELGALSYVESRADDVPHGKLTSFPRAVHLTEDEIVYVSTVTFTDRLHRDAVNAKVMADPRVQDAFTNPPADMNRMIFGGFEVKVGPAEAA